MIPFKDIVSAWKSTYGIKWPVLQFSLILFGLPVITLQIIYRVVPLYIENFILGLIIVSLTITVLNIITAYSTLLIVMIGIRQMKQKPISVEALKNDINKREMGVFYLIAVYIIFQIFSLYIIYVLPPNIIIGYLYLTAYFYLTVPVFVFALPLVIYKHEYYKKAFNKGYKLLGKYWKEITCYLFIPYIVVNEFFVWYETLVMNPQFLQVYAPTYWWLIPVPIILFVIWIIPFFANIAGIIYRNAEQTLDMKN